MWTLCRADEIADDSARGFELEGHALVAVRKDGQLHVYVNWCPHLGIELNIQPDEFLDYERNYLQCANHGALFMIEDGLCVLGPCKGRSLVRVDFTVSDGNLCVTTLPQQRF